MLSKADDFPIHQTSEPIAYAGTDRNFYDRYFFNGFAPDGSEFFAIAFGVYPHLNIADAHFSVIRNGVQYCVHASKFLYMERFDIEVGPIRIEVLEPLQKLKVTIAPTDGIAAEIIFEGRSFPIEEPRFIHRFGPRTFMDYTRLTQNGFYSGWIEVDGKRVDIAAGSVGTRDRSWGVRPIGASDPQPHAPAIIPGMFWIWSPLNFADRSVYFHISADAAGHAWNTRAAVVPDGAQAAEIHETSDAKIALDFQPGTRHARSATLTIRPEDQPPIRIDFEPLHRFQMRGIGYFHPAWAHGGYKGELIVEREDIDLQKIDVMQVENMHIQAICQVSLSQEGQPAETRIGILEQLVLGPYAPYGFKGMLDPAS